MCFIGGGGGDGVVRWWGGGKCFQNLLNFVTIATGHEFVNIGRVHLSSQIRFPLPDVFFCSQKIVKILTV